MNHKQKVKLARRMMTKEEWQKGNISKSRTPIFESKAWEERKAAIQKRVERKILI